MRVFLRSNVMTWEQEKEILKDVYYEKGKADDALAMLKEGLEISFITRITGLSEEKILEIQKNSRDE